MAMDNERARTRHQPLVQLHDRQNRRLGAVRRVLADMDDRLGGHPISTDELYDARGLPA